MCITWLVFQMTGETSGFFAYFQSLQVCRKTILFLAKHFFLNSLGLVFFYLQFQQSCVQKSSSSCSFLCRLFLQSFGFVPPSIPVIPRNFQSKDGKQKEAGISQDAQSRVIHPPFLPLITMPLLFLLLSGSCIQWGFFGVFFLRLKQNIPEYSGAICKKMSMAAPKTGITFV